MRSPLFAEELEAVLASSNATRRSDILNRITDLFIYGAERYSPDHVRLFGDVMARLLRGMDKQGRARLAERLAPIANAPGNVIHMLALDHDIAVAGPVLAQSERLGERELMQIASSKGRSHLLAMARRRSLSAAVSNVLIARADRELLNVLAAHGGAQFSKAGRQRLDERQRTDAELTPLRTPPGESEIYRYARNGKLADTAAALSIVSGMPKDAVECALLNPRAEAILMLARAVGLSSITTEAMLRLHATDCGMSADDVEQALARFNRLPRDSARRVLNFFRIRLHKQAQDVQAQDVQAHHLHAQDVHAQDMHAQDTAPPVLVAET
jgi:uncharacterized protein (DUF2336 family)